MRITSDAHLDHGLHESVVAHIAERFADRDAFFVETFELPPELPTAMCALYGPELGDEPVPDSEVVLEVRGTRAGPSRLCSRPPRATRTVTVVAGPHEGEPCVLYTAFGGPPSAREPWDPTLTTPAQVAHSRSFWAKHALARGA